MGDYTAHIHIRHPHNRVILWFLKKLGIGSNLSYEFGITSQGGLENNNNSNSKRPHDPEGRSTVEVTQSIIIIIIMIIFESDSLEGQKNLSLA